MKQLPPEFTEYAGDELMTNFDGSISFAVSEAIRDKPLFARYPGYNFNGKCWFDGQWNCAVWVYHSHVETLSARTLEEIMQTVSDTYGYD